MIMFTGEQMTEEYRQMNPYMKVPVIDDGGFILTERYQLLLF